MTEQSYMTRVYLARLGRVFSNAAIICAIVAMSGLLSFLLSVTYLVILVIIVIMTLGAIFAIVPTFGTYFSTGAAAAETFSAVLAAAAPGLVVAAVVLSVASMALLWLDPDKKPGARMVVAVLTIVLPLVLYFALSGGGTV